MSFNYKVACISQIKNNNVVNKGNFLFDGKALKVNNHGIQEPLCASFNSENEQCIGIFEGAYSPNGAHTAINCLRYFQKQKDVLDLDYIFQLQDFFKAADRVICEQDNSKDKNVSSVVMFVRYNGIYLQTCGRVSAYLLRNDKLIRLNPDDTIARAFGASGVLNPQPVFGEIKSNDRIVFCTDIIKKTLSDSQFLDIVSKSTDCSICAKKLSTIALESSQDFDCSTVAVMDVYDETSEGYWVLPNLSPTQVVVNEVTGEFEIDPNAKTMEILSGNAINSSSDENLNLTSIADEEPIDNFYTTNQESINVQDVSPVDNFEKTHPKLEPQSKSSRIDKDKSDSNSLSNALVYVLVAIVSVIIGLLLTFAIKTLAKPSDNVEPTSYISDSVSQESISPNTQSIDSSIDLY